MAKNKKTIRKEALKDMETVLNKHGLDSDGAGIISTYHGNKKCPKGMKPVRLSFKENGKTVIKTVCLKI